MSRTLKLGWSRGMLELRTYIRNPAAVGFTLLFPVVMMVLFASIFTDQVPGTSANYSQVFVAGIIGSSIMSVSFVGLAIGVVTDRDGRQLKRLAGMPLPRASYFIGKMVMSLAVSIGEVVLCVAVGATLFGLTIPTSPGRLLTLVWVLLLGVCAATVMGVLVGGRISSIKAAPAVLNIPFVALQFISGVFLPPDQLPRSLYRIAGFFPLRWICQGMRSVFLPDEFQRVEPTGSWQHLPTALVLAAWAVGGLLLARLTFRWIDD